jgi:hypothetical protein
VRSGDMRKLSTILVAHEILVRPKIEKEPRHAS